MTRYPDRVFTQRILNELFIEHVKAWFASEGEREASRIQGIESKDELRIEMEEAAQKWSAAYSSIISGQFIGLHRSRDEAYWDLILSNHRYWIALRRFEELEKHLRKEEDERRAREIWNFRLAAIGAFILSLISTIGTIAALVIAYKQWK